MNRLAKKAICILLLTSGPALSQMPGIPGTDAVETMTPVFDAAYTMQPRAGLFGITELMMAGLNGDFDTAVSLIESGADVNETDNSQSTALMWSAWSGNEALVALLIANGADVNATAANGANALGNALSSERAAVAIQLLEAGADPNALGDYSRSYLESAARLGRVDVIDALIEKGVDIDRFGLGALTAAISRANFDAAERLIEAGAAVDGDKADGRSSPLRIAAYAGDAKLVTLLLAHGANPGPDGSDSSPLQTASAQGHLEIVRVLVDSGAPINIKDVASPLAAGRTDIAHFLLERLDVDTLSRSEVEGFLLIADAAGEQDLVHQFLDASNAPGLDDDTVRLVFRQVTESSCAVSLWKPGQDNARKIDALDNLCEAELFVADHTDTLFAIESNTIHAVNLSDDSISVSIPLPTTQMDVQLEALKQKLRQGRTDLNFDGLRAKVGVAGFAETGDVAVGMHVGGLADETYGYLFVLVDDEWIFVSEQTCHRFDWRCRFAGLEGRPIDDWPVQRSAWHPYLRRNTHFVSKSAGPNPQAEYGGKIDTIQLAIDGQSLVLRVSTAEGGHCADECTYTTRLESQIGNGESMVLSDNNGNNSIAGRYALISHGYNTGTRVVDILTGQNLFGELEAATWVEGAANP